VSRAPGVLVVDDDRTFRAAVCADLTELGCVTEDAADAREALRRLEAEDFDLLLLDLRMPGLSGHDLMRRLPRRVRVIGMSGAVTVEDVVALMRRGALDFLTKPFTFDQLETALRRALGPMVPARTSRRRTSGRCSTSRRVSRREQTSDRPADRVEDLDVAEVELPVIAPIAAEIRRLLREPARSVEAVERVLKRDPTITAALLKLANSSFYRGQVPVEGLRAACVRLGDRRALTVAHAALIRGLYDLDGDLRLVADAMWRNTAVTAHVARELADRTGLVDPEQVHLAATLHNLGELVLLRAASRMANSRPTSSAERLARMIRESHEDVGRRLMKAWGMPGDVVLLAGAHHRKPWRPESKEATIRRRLVLASWSGAWRAGHRYLGGPDPEEPDDLLESAGLGRADLDEALELAGACLAEAEERVR